MTDATHPIAYSLYPSQALPLRRCLQPWFFRIHDTFSHSFYHMSTLIVIQNLLQAVFGNLNIDAGPLRLQHHCDTGITSAPSPVHSFG